MRPAAAACVLTFLVAFAITEPCNAVAANPLEPFLAANASGALSIVTRRTTQVDYYPITAWTPSTMRAQMPQSWTGETRWRINSRYLLRRTAPGCRVSNATVTLQIFQTMPGWRPAHRPDPQVRAAWARSFAALKVHEQGHVVRAEQVANTERQLLAEPTVGDCPEVRTVLTRGFDAAVAAGNVADVAYDLKTGHGRTQGTWFVDPATAIHRYPGAAGLRSAALLTSTILFSTAAAAWLLRALRRRRALD